MYLPHNLILWTALLAAVYVGSTSGGGPAIGKLCLLDKPNFT